VIHLLRRALTAPVLLAVAVVLQVSLVNRLPLPGGAHPNLVILVVAALAVSSGPVTGMIAGFLGGLALDVAPPGSDLVGESALVCCAVGYGCGALAAWRLSSPGGAPRTTPGGRVIPVTPFTSASSSGMWRGAAREVPLRALPLMAASVVLGELLQVGLGMLVSDPSMTMSAVQHVLPAAVTYDMALSPFVLLLVTAARGSEEPGTAGFAAVSVVLATPVAATRARAAFRAAGAGVQARPGGVTRLTFSETRPAPVRAPARADPKLRFAAGNGPSSSRTGSPHSRTPPAGRQGAGSWGAGSAGGPRGSAWLRDGGTQRGAGHPGSALQRGPGQARPPKVAFGGGRRDGLIGGSVLGNGSFGSGLRGSSGGFRGALGPSLFAGGDSRRGSVFRGSAFRGSAFRGSALSGGGLRGATFRGSTPGGAMPRGSAFRGSGARSGSLGSGALAGRAAWSRGIGARAFRDDGPGRNWLRDSGSRARAMRPGKRHSGWLAGSGELGGASRRGSAPGKGWLRPARPPAPIRRATPGRGWLSRKPLKLMAGKTRKGGRR
jgi:hypothetical protein